MIKEIQDVMRSLTEQDANRIYENLENPAGILPNLEEALGKMKDEIRRCPGCRRRMMFSELIHFLVSVRWSEESLTKLREWYGDAVADFAASDHPWNRISEDELKALPADQLPVLDRYSSKRQSAALQRQSETADFPRPACPQCVLKHLADAGILMIEALHGYPVHRAWAIGNLSQAEQECYAISPEFAADIRAVRLRIMSEPEFTPDFNPLLERALELAGQAASGPLVTVLTVTRDRPALFNLHEQMLARQTYRNFRWIVVDDGQKPVSPERQCVYVRRPYEPKKCFTHRENLLVGLDKWHGGILVFMEDDDYYPPEYLAETVKLAQIGTGLFGWKNPFYYWPLEKHRTLNRRDDLCITAFSGCHYRHRERLLEIIRVCTGNFVDVDLWHKFNDKVMREYTASPGPIGIKGISGNGFSREHRKVFESSEHEFEPWFREQVGEEFFAKYQQIISGAENAPANQKG